jgi:coenzyme F420 hydrogenase subunit beta
MTELMSAPKSLAEVAASGLCTGCGLCAGIAPEAVQLVMTQDGYQRPVQDRALDRDRTRRLLELCPGVSLRMNEIDAPQVDLAWGPYHRILKGHANDEEMRFRASSGGVISAIAKFLLDTKRVDFVLHVATDPAAPMRSHIQTSRSRSEIIAGAGARYGPAAPLETIGRLLDQEQPFAVIGKPCDIAGVRNLMRLDARAARLIRLTVAFFCAGVSSLRISERVVGKYGLAPEAVSVMRYRGHGCPGPTYIEASDGRVFLQTYDETWSEELNQEIQFRCKICPDGTGEQADIACGDAWIGVDGQLTAEHPGWNAVLARTALGDGVLREMEAAGVITTDTCDIAHLNRVQPHQVERKRVALARLAGLALRGEPLPRYRGFRLIANAWRGSSIVWRNLIGTLRRVGRGANRENLQPYRSGE